MAQFMTYENPNKTTKAIYPYLLDIQSDLLSDLRTTIVIPLSPKNLVGKATIAKLSPSLEVKGKTFVALTQQIAGIDRKVLGKEVEDLSKHRLEIIAALDFVISGI